MQCRMLTARVLNKQCAKFENSNDFCTSIPQSQTYEYEIV